MATSNYYEVPPAPDAQAAENRLVNKALTAFPQPYITGLKLKADISIGDLVLNTIDSVTGVVWVCTDIQGWWQIADVEMQDLPRGWGDGSYDAKGRYTNRLITLTGSFLTQDPSQVEAARDKLVRAVSLVHRGAWLKVNETIPKVAYVRLSGTPEITNVNARGRTDFSIGLKAPDPIKYELVDNDVLSYNQADLSVGGSVTITNRGNTKVPVIFEVAGTFTASASSPLTITNTTTSKSVYVVASQSTSDILAIDTYNREVLFNDEGYETGLGASRRRLSTLVDWIELEPGNNTITLTGSGTGTCRVLYKSGWIG